MGKISPVSIKYVIHAKFFAEGILEKPDIIGAIFGQTEGLLGEELELRELQKNGKIGRIEVNTESKDSKTEGVILIPTSIDKTDTTLIGAAIETIERIGPATAKVVVEKIEDVRVNKREYILERAKKLLEQMSETSPDSREMQTEITESVREGKIIEYGVEKLPAGPDMENPEIIVVEGRADVLNLLRYGIKNVIAMNGVSLPKEITELGKTKTLTLFVDGDRGGILIAKDALENSKVAFVAQAPSGMEVEELTGKEILASIRSKVSAEEFARTKVERQGEGSEGRYSGRGRGTVGGRGRRPSYRSEREESTIDSYERKDATDDEIRRMQNAMKDIEGTKSALLLNDNFETIRRVSANDLQRALRSIKGISVVVFDGQANGYVLNAAERAGVRHLGAKSFSHTRDSRVNLVSL
ncbi:MAG: DNA primase [Nanoarchaeota archaeon]|nr:DNA primase [Nanoarchaeota archaeon]